MKIDLVSSKPEGKEIKHKTKKHKMKKHQQKIISQKDEVYIERLRKVLKVSKNKKIEY